MIVLIVCNIFGEIKNQYFDLGGVGSSVHPAASPLPLQRLQLEDIIGGSPMSQRSIVRRESHVLADISEVDTLDSTAMTDQAVHNISAMFPTVEESHIRDLLKKWVTPNLT